MQTIVNGLVTEVKGEGKPIILLHGYLSSKESFSYQINYLSKFRKVYAPDLLGFGKSPPLTTPYSLDDYVSLVFEFVNSLGIDSYDILAHSFGGRIAIRLALKDKRANKIILTGSAGLKPRRTPLYYIRIYLYKILKKVLPKKCLKGFGSSEYKSLSDVMKLSYLKIVNTHQDNEVKNLKNKTYLIYGNRDTKTPLYMAKKFNKLIKNSTLTIINGAGHFAFIDNPRLFNALIKEFLCGD